MREFRCEVICVRYHYRTGQFPNGPGPQWQSRPGAMQLMQVPTIVGASYKAAISLLPVL